MKLGILLSALSHVLLLSWGLFWLSAPPPHEAVEIEALPVAIVPYSSISQIQQGERKAPAAEKSAPVPTSKPVQVKDAENVGDNKIDLKSVEKAKPAPTTVEATASPEKAETPVPVPTSEPEVVPQPVKEPEPVPATEVAALPEPQQAVLPDPVAEAISQAVDIKPESETVPENIPVPTARPTPPKAQTAKTPERKNNQDRQETSKQASAKDSDFNADEVAALLNRQDAAGGGAKQSNDEAALGGRITTEGSQLSQSEMDALRGQIQRCWQIVPGLSEAADVRVTVTMRLDRDGAIDGRPSVEASGGTEQTRRVLSGGARRAVLRCAPYNLPKEKYDAWSDVIVNFDPSQMF